MNKSVKEKVLVTLLCEWEDCMLIYDNMELFVKHVRDHLAEHRNSESNHLEDIQKEDRMICLWKDCASESKFESWEELAQHVYYHTFHQKLKCHGIALLQNQSQNYKCLLDNSSRNLIPDSPFKLVCHWLECRKTFEDPETFYNHVSGHVEDYPSGNNVKGGCRCRWESCEVTVKSKHKLRDHLRSHTQEKLFACPTCGGLFVNSTKFNDHIQRQADLSTLTYRCSYCSKMFHNKRFLRDHMRHHVYHYKCPFCDMTCPNQSSLRTHIRYRHSDHRPYSCEVCGFKTKLAVDLKKHLECHDGDWLRCEVGGCSYRARFPWEMNLHMKNKHEGLEEGKYLCHLCSLKYTRGTHLTKHLKTKHRLREPSGHVRLRYKLHDDNFYRLQEFRYESSELQEQLLAVELTTNDDQEDSEDSDDPASLDIPKQKGNSSGNSPADDECVTVVEMEDIFYENFDG